jgi:tetratricopeptide (TPR) repeat protein
MRPGAHLWILFLLALSLRLAHVADIRGQVVFSAPLVDAGAYDVAARAVAARGPGAIETPYYQPPLYPMLLGALYAATGGSYLAPRLVQAGVGALTVALVAMLAALAGGRRAGWIAGGLLLAYGPVLYFEGELLPPTMLLALHTAALLLLARAERAARPLRPLLAGGLLLGVAAATRPTGLLLAAFAAAWWWAGAARRARPAAASRDVAAFVLAVLLPIVPFTLANVLLGREPILVSWNGGINFYVGNGAGSDSLTAIRPGYAWEGLQLEPLRAGVHGSRRAESDYWVRRGLREAAADPLAWAAALGRKTLRLLDARETPRNTDWEDFRRDSRLLSLPLGGFGLVAPLALLGALAAFAPRGPAPPRVRSLLGVQLLAVAAQNLGFFVADRYRLEAVPALCVLAGLGLDQALRRRGRVGWRAALLIAAFAAVVHVDFLGERRIDEARGAVWRAVALEQAGFRAGSGRKLQEALRLAPDDVDVHRLLGDHFVGRGEVARALEHYDRALAGAPDFVDALVAKARVLDQLGRQQEAEATYRSAAAADPYDARVRLLYGVHLARARRWDEARTQFEAGLMIDPRNDDLRANLGNLERIRGGS